MINMDIILLIATALFGAIALMSIDKIRSLKYKNVELEKELARKERAYANVMLELHRFVDDFNEWHNVKISFGANDNDGIDITYGEE